METRKAYSYIRFSTPEQLKGDSLRRQLEASEKYAKENGLRLDTTLRMQDLGKSAFHGAHRTKGALGDFLRMVEVGRIEKGSYLIIESLDRISREQIMNALNQFISIINSGIRLVTLYDGTIYDEDSVNKNPHILMFSIGMMARAHEESKVKSIRVSSAREKERQDAKKGIRKMSKKAPYWLKLSSNRKEYIIIPEVCKAVETIFRLKLNGQGVDAIVRQLNNDENIWKPPKHDGRISGGWRNSYVRKILNNKAVIGVFQPHQLKDGKRVPIKNEIWEDYYPLIIDKSLFYAVQKQIETNRNSAGQSGGRRGKIKNLFTSLVKCGLCKFPMHLIDKGKPPKGSLYLHCDNSRRKMSCEAKPVKYDEFEKLFFKEFEELDISEISLDKDEITIKKNDLIRKVEGMEKENSDLEMQIDNLSDTIANTNNKESRLKLEEKLQERLEMKDELVKSKNNAESQLSELQYSEEEIKEDIDLSNIIYEQLKSLKSEEEIIKFRLILREQIKKVFKEIEIYPLMEKDQRIKETDEAGIYIKMTSKHIRKMRLKYRNENNRTGTVFFQTVIEKPDFDPNLYKIALRKYVKSLEKGKNK